MNLSISDSSKYSSQELFCGIISLPIKLRPVFLFLQDETFRKDHVSVVIPNKHKSEQIIIELPGFFYIFNNDQYVL